MSLYSLSLSEMAEGLRAGEFSCEELTQSSVDRIGATQPAINALTTDSFEQALAQAREVDARPAGRSWQPLEGIPFLHKDIFCTEGVTTSCGSKMLANFVPPYSATVHQKLRDQGAVCVGKTNMDEFAMGSSNENSYFGPVRNPWNTDRVTGGSSGGSAAAVAARWTPFATGTDTGGSVRQPAAFCGLTGIKPTYGRVSRWGIVAFASSLDQAGIIARSAHDCALGLGAIAGFDPQDSTSVDRPVPDYAAGLQSSLEGVRVGVPDEYFGEGIETPVADLAHAAIDDLAKAGAQIERVSLPHAHLAVPTYYIVAPAEASSNLSRFDGVRYGYRCENPRDLTDLYMRSRGEGFGTEVKRRILVGTYALSAGYYDAFYLKAQRVRRLIAADFEQAFEKVDVLVGPTTPTPAFEVGEKAHDPVSMYMADINTTALNLAGLPGLSMPVGQVDGLPVGMQVIGNYFDEGRILNVAHQYQQLTSWHTAAPEMLS